MSGVTTAEQATILKSLTQIRHRLYAVRLTERAVLGLVAAGIVAVFLVGGRVVFARYPWLGGMLTGAPLAGAVWLWLRARRLADPAGSLSRRAGVSVGVLRIAASLVGLTVLGAFLMLSISWRRSAPLWTIPAGTGVVFLIGAAATVKPVQAKVAAIFVDQQVGLEERISTALEFLESKPATELESAFRAPVIASAVNACATIRTAKVGYSRMDRRVYALAATVAIAAAGVSMLTPMTALAGPIVRHYEPVAESGKTLAEKIKEMEAKQKIDDPALEAKMKELRNIAESMKKGDMSPFQANEELTKLEQQIKDEQKDEDKVGDVEKAMEASKDMQDMAKASDEVKSATERNAGSNSPGAQSEREKAESGVKKAAGDIAGKLAGMSEKEKKDLSDELKREADKSKDPQVKKDLEDASKAAASGNAGEMEKSLADAGNQMGQQGAQQQMSSEAAREAMNRIEQAQGGGMSAGEQQSKPGGGEQRGGQQNQPGEQQGGGSQGSEQQGSSSAQGGGNQPGKQQNGQGSGTGNGKDGSQTEGNGSTNFSAPGWPGEKNNGAPLGGTGTFVKVYGEKPIDTRGQMVGTQGHINPLGTPSGSMETMAKGDDGKAEIQTYEHELPAARKKALDDLLTQSIPPQDKDLIRAYYDK